MEWSRRIKLMTEWSVATAALIAGFWGTWYFIAGSIPIIGSIPNGPLAISRWWDVFLGPIYSIAIILLLSIEEIWSETWRRGLLIIGFCFFAILFPSFVIAPILGIISGIVLVFGFIIFLGSATFLHWLVSTNRSEGIKTQKSGTA